MISRLKKSAKDPNRHFPKEGIYVLCCAVLSHSVVFDFVTVWTVACQSPPSMRFSRKEYWSGLLFLTPGDLPDPGIKPVCLMSSALASRFFTTSATWEAHIYIYIYIVVVQSLSNVQLFATPWTVARQASQSITISWSLLKLTSIELVMPSKYLVLSSPSLPALNLSQCQGLF